MIKELSIRIFTFFIILLVISSLFSPVLFGINGKCEQVTCDNFTPRLNTFFVNKDNNITITIKGGLGIRIEICNYENTTIYLVNWSIIIDAPIVILGRSTMASISEIPPGECVNISSVFILGLGPVTITVQINDIMGSAKGCLIGPFVFV